MAGEGNSRRVVEISIWFLLLLVVCVVAFLMINKCNAEKDSLKAQLEQQEKLVGQVEAERDHLQDYLRELKANIDNYTVGQVSQLKTEIANLLNEKAEAVSEVETISGEELPEEEVENVEVEVENVEEEGIEEEAE